MNLTIELPTPVDPTLARELDTAAREAIGVRLYCESKISQGKLAEFLSISRSEVEDLLARHQVVNEFNIDEIATQVSKT